MSKHASSNRDAAREQIRIVRVATEQGPRWGVVDEDRVRAVDGDPFSAGEEGDPLGELASLRLLAPTVPSKIVCVGLNYPAHADESGAEVPTEPLLFFKPPSAVVGLGAPIVLPAQSERVDYEAELVVVMGRRCRNVGSHQAWDYVWGVTCGNDVTARDLQWRDDQWARAKGFDTFCPLGPWAVLGMTEEEAADLELVCRVNREVRQRAMTSDMVFSPAELIAYISTIMTLEPGDVVMTGTPHGVGPLTPRDEVEVSIQGVGTLQNVAAAAR
jgi:2-keto-4-pentenoate hydratase/2-oxohepta-3-ene-1,7-dioic acid hydratase in catechol pathway